MLYTEVPLPVEPPSSQQEIGRFLQSLGEVIALDLRELREALGL